MAEADDLEDRIAECDAVLADEAGSTDPASRLRVARAFLRKGYALSVRRRYGQALGVYEEMLERFDDADEPKIQLRVAIAL